jgi:hypothetical protein
MVAGFNIKVDIWRVTWQDDDSVGGAVVTGSWAYKDVSARIQEVPVDAVFLQQPGIETLQIYQMTIKPSTLTIYQRDEIEITWPPEHRLYEVRMRVMGDAHSSFHPREERGYLVLNLTRSVRAHGSQ